MVNEYIKRSHPHTTRHKTNLPPVYNYSFYAAFSLVVGY